MGEFNQEELDEKIMNEIKEKSENLEIPESLSPDNIMKRIKEQKVKKGRFNSGVRIITTVLAASLVLVVGVGMFGKLSGKPNMLGVNKSYSSDSKKDNGTVEEISSFKSYEEIYELLEESGEVYFGYTNGVIMDDAESSLDGETSGSKGDGMTTGNSSAEEYTGTNVQVEGVDEADIIKTDGKHIFVFDTDENIIRIVEANGSETKVVAKINNSLDMFCDYIIGDMYLHNDKLVVVCCDGYWGRETYVVTYDVSDVDKPTKIGMITKEGAVHSSRMVDGKLYVFTNEYLPYDEERNEYVPKLNGEKIECKKIYACGCSNYNSYTTLFSVDLNKPNEVMDVKSILTNNSYIYASKNNIYILASGERKKGSYIKNVTNIFKIEYNDGIFTPVAEGEVDGRLRDQFSMDEYKDTFRVLTTSSSYRVYDNSFVGEIMEEVFPDDYQTTTNNVFVLDSKLKVMGEIKGLAKGERIYSARFDGDMGYFVTFRETDPVFAVDFSDAANPKVLGELKVSGFSEYLHMWSDNLMIGIGEEVDEKTGERLGVKISMFDVSDPENMKELHKIVIDGEYSEALYNHKALLINPEKNLIGFAIEDYDWMDDIGESDYTMSYNIFGYDNEKGFVEIEKYVDDAEEYRRIRGVHIGDYVYIISPGDYVRVFDISNKETISKIRI